MNILSIAGWIVGVAGGIAIIWKVLNWINKIIEGIRCQLRNLMTKIYYKYKDEKKMPQYEAENFHYAYNAYKALNGNSFITDIYEEVKDWEVIR